MHKNYLACRGCLWGLAVALGAFGAHGLEKITTDGKILMVFKQECSTRFIMRWHCWLLRIIYEKYPGTDWINWAGYFLLLELFFFPVHLYLLTVFKATGNSAVKMCRTDHTCSVVCFLLPDGFIF